MLSCNYCDFGRIEGTAALLLADPDFQTLRHPLLTVKLRAVDCLGLFDAYICDLWPKESIIE